MPDREKGGFVASQLSLGTRIHCQSRRLRRPLRALEIDSSHGQAGGSSSDMGCSYLDIRQTVSVCLIESNK
jgi:hypothetical protein